MISLVLYWKKQTKEVVLRARRRPVQLLARVLPGSADMKLTGVRRDETSTRIRDPLRIK